VTQLLDNLSVRGKVIGAFAAVLVCATGLGLFAIQRLDAVNANAQEIRDNWLPSTRVLGRMAQVTERLRSNQGLQLLATTDAQRQPSVVIVKDQIEIYTKERQAYQPLIVPGEEQRLVAAIDAASRQDRSNGEWLAAAIRTQLQLEAGALAPVGRGEVVRPNVAHVAPGDLEAAYQTTERVQRLSRDMKLSLEEWTLLSHCEQPVSLRDLRTESFLLLRDGHCFRETSVAACQRARLNPRVKLAAVMHVSNVLGAITDPSMQPDSLTDKKVSAASVPFTLPLI
jgi:hypothetical protein